MDDRGLGFAAARVFLNLELSALNKFAHGGDGLQSARTDCAGTEMHVDSAIKVAYVYP